MSIFSKNQFSPLDLIVPLQLQFSLPRRFERHRETFKLVEDKTAQTPEQVYRSSLEDVIAINGALAKFCRTPEEVVQMCRLGLENEGQLRLIMNAVQTAGKK